MKVSKFWSKENQIVQDNTGYEFNLNCWHGSNESQADADAGAQEKIRRWIDKLTRGEKINEYEYQQTEIREELIEEIKANDGTLIGAVTRNRYGALVLNTSCVLIADIDVEKPTFFAKLFGKKENNKNSLLDRVNSFAARHPDSSLVLYETHSGLRVFFTHQEFHPRSQDSRDILTALGSDALYQRLCYSQQCYRARLSPKPWRCGHPRPPNRFPRQTTQTQAAFDQWHRTYEEVSRQFTVCKPLATLGPPDACSAARRILDVHDAIAINNKSSTLA